MVAIGFAFVTTLLASGGFVGGALHDGDTTIPTRLVSWGLKDKTRQCPIGTDGSDLLLLETLLLVLCPALPPVTLIPSTSAATATTSASPEPSTGTVGLHAAGFDLPHLLFTVFLLALDEQVLTVPLGLGIEVQESLLLLFRLKLDENASLEGLVGRATETDGVRGAVGCEEGFNVELGAGFFLPKSLGVDASAHGLILEHLDDVGVVFGFNGLREGGLATHVGVVFCEFQGFRGLESFDDRAEGLETAHALEGVQEFEGNRVVGAAAHLGEEEFVIDKVGVGEVKFNLYTS